MNANFFSGLISVVLAPAIFGFYMDYIFQSVLKKEDVSYVQDFAKQETIILSIAWIVFRLIGAVFWADVEGGPWGKLLMFATILSLVCLIVYMKKFGDPSEEPFGIRYTPSGHELRSTPNRKNRLDKEVLKSYVVTLLSTIILISGLSSLTFELVVQSKKGKENDGSYFNINNPFEKEKMNYSMEDLYKYAAPWAFLIDAMLRLWMIGVGRCVSFVIYYSIRPYINSVLYLFQ